MSRGPGHAAPALLCGPAMLYPGRMTRRLILDISRTLSRAKHPVPTGIDRVELAYAEGLLAREEGRLEFAALHPLGRFAHLSRGAARAFLDVTARRWRGEAAAGDDVARAARRLQRTLLLRSPIGAGIRLLRKRGRSVYLLMSHHHLDRPHVIVDVMQRDRAAFICMVHDLIPMEFPEYARPNEPARHQRRIETVARLADAVVVNSEATRQSLLPWLARAGRNPPVLVAPLGIDPVRSADAAVAKAWSGVETARALFIYIGTIEPRKNHLLLLHIWRRLAEERGPAAPRLLLIGRRGWENEQILDMLERCPSLAGVVEEHSALSDAQTRALLARASALLLPSFAEGYGLPLAEALAQGVPALCSDLPALREVGQDVPEYLDPLDGAGWMRAILDYAAPDSARRAAQLDRMRAWKAPGWGDHLARVLDLADHGVA